MLPEERNGSFERICRIGIGLRREVADQRVFRAVVVHGLDLPARRRACS